MPNSTAGKPLQNTSLEDFVQVFRKHKRIAITFFVIVLGSTIFYSLVQAKVFRAETTILIERGGTKVLPFRGILATDTRARDFYLTQYELLKSRAVGKRVMDALGLWQGYKWSKDPVGSFLASINVKPIESSRLARVSAESTDPAQAAQIADAMVQFYIEQNLHNKTVMSQRAAGWLETKIEDVRAKLADSEHQFEVVKLKKKLAELNEKYLPKHPDVIRTRVRLEKIEGQLGDELKELEFDNLSLLHNQLEREVEGNRNLHQQMLKRLKETVASEGVEETNIFVVDAAEIPTGHVRPRVGRNVLLAIFIGAFGALGICLAFEAIDNTVKTVEEIEELAELPVLGSLLEWEAGHGELIMEEKPMSNEAEAFRSIRTSLLFSSPDRPLRALMVTSPSPSEGKSVTASNLALTIAQSGAGVLLVDADLRKPRLDLLFDVSGKQGLTEAITGSASPADLIQKTRFQNLFLLTSGAIPPTPSELIGSQKMRHLVKEFREQFDYVIFDAPPFMAVTDPVILGSALDGVIVVVRYHKTPKNVLERVKQKFLDVQANVVGVILNAVNLKHEGYRYHSYYQSYSKDDQAQQPTKVK